MKLEDVDISRLSPMMQEYAAVKSEYPDCIVMYRLGDFYEMFFEDAIDASEILEIALTGRDCGLEERAPMAGVPHHALDQYSSKLVDAGRKVAVVDQMENPKEAKGLVKRAVTRIITPGTLTDVEALRRDENNYLLSLFFHGESLGIAFGDITTGEMFCYEELSDADAMEWVGILHPSEIILAGDGTLSLPDESKVFITRLSEVPMDLKTLGKQLASYLPKREAAKLQKRAFALIAAVNLFTYIYRLRDEPLVHVNRITLLQEKSYLRLDRSTRDNLELERNSEDFSSKNTLFWVLNETQTAMGSRLLHQWLEFPLVDKKRIEHRLDVVEYLTGDLSLLAKIRESLRRVYDLERLLSKLSFNRGNARDLLALSYSLEPLPMLMAMLKKTGFRLFEEWVESFDPLEDIRERIDKAIVSQPPILLTEGGLIREGYDDELDRMKKDGDTARDFLAAYENEEREKTGIRNLRIIYRKNTGYFIEVTKANATRVPEEYLRRQTLKNSERYTTDVLEQTAGKIIGSEQTIFAREYDLFQALRKYIADQAIRLQKSAEKLARLDLLQSFAQSAVKNGYVRPQFTREDRIEILGARHPVVERNISEAYIPNDLIIGNRKNRIQIITGPNMAGKSTYMRQNALIIIMAQLGSFVPCERCILPITDRIFTRIGAGDHLARGESTFMVEMKEMANILKNATVKSFIVLDEVGRGTSTNDGLSIAYAIIEYLSQKLSAKTLFATHYHELTVLGDDLSNVTNRKVDIAEEDGELIFLRKVVEGKANRSYGIDVARLSGIPDAILNRAQYVLENIDALNNLGFLEEAREVKERQQDFSDFQKNVLLEEIRSIDMDTMTPVDAFQKLMKIIEQAKNVE